MRSMIAALPGPPPMQSDASVGAAALPQLVGQRQREARAGRAERMAERDRAAVHVPRPAP